MPTVKHPVLIFTGGHHSSALAVALALKDKGWQIIWLGHRQSQWQDRSDSAEYREVTASGIRFINLKAGKIYHTFNPLKLIRLPWGFLQALYFLLKLKDEFGSDLKGIVTFGGYLGVPVVFWGWIMKLPVIAHEQTMSAGWANKMIAVFARKIAISWPDSHHHYPASKIVLTGLPLRPEIVSIKRSLSQTDRVPGQIYITGGKQGSHKINAALLPALNKLLLHHTVIHQTGFSSVFNDYQQSLDAQKQLPPYLSSKYQVRDYLPPDQAARMLATSGIVVSRAGAHIVHELAYLKTRCVLIPIPWSSHHEQDQNADFLASRNQAIILPEDQLNPDNLLAAISSATKLHPKETKIAENGLQNMVELIESELKNI